MVVLNQYNQLPVPWPPVVAQVKESGNLSELQSNSITVMLSELPDLCIFAPVR